MSLYIDDSGTRHPDRNPSNRLPKHGHDWFALGGVLIRDSDQEIIKNAHQRFCAKWKVSGPLHSSEIRGHRGAFRFLHHLSPNEKSRFYDDVRKLVTQPCLTAIACVVDRPGYNARYRLKYARKRWSLCKTAFHVVVERAAKFARQDGSYLRVFIERSDKITDNRMRGYYEALRDTGQPFDKARSLKYAPLSPQDFAETLYEFKTKNKTSALMQLADVVLWPICIGGYVPEHPSYQALRRAGSLIDNKIPEAARATEGIKYSCWELQEGKGLAQEPDPEKDQSPDECPSFGSATKG